MYKDNNAFLKKDDALEVNGDEGKKNGNAPV